MIANKLVIDTSQYGNIYVTGDLHGRKKYLIKELGIIGFDYTQDLLISVGDLIDRGDEDLATLELVDNFANNRGDLNFFKACIGNHELMAYKALKPNHTVEELLDDLSSHLWFYNGGGWFYGMLQLCENENEESMMYKRLRKDVLSCIEKMYAEIELVVDGITVKVSHSGRFDGNFKLPINLDEYEIDLDNQNIDPFWSRDYDRTPIKDTLFIHGHTPQKHIPHFLKESGTMLIDSGVAYRPDRLKVFNIEDLVKMYKGD